jgi:wobble nucleotide-excising tRNase
MIIGAKHVRHVGLLNDAATSDSFAALTLIHGDNGIGKSTFISVVAAAAEGDSIGVLARTTIDQTFAPEIEFHQVDGDGSASSAIFNQRQWQSRLDLVSVFNSDFIDRNLYAGGVIAADQKYALLDFAIGEDAVSARADIEQYNARAISLQADVTAAENQIRGAIGSTMTIDEFLSTDPADGLAAEIEGLSNRLQVWDRQSELFSGGTPNEISLALIDAADISELLVRGVDGLDEAAVARVQEHVAAHLSDHTERWLGEGLALDATSYCPFCGQDVRSNTLVSSYREYFKAEYGAHVTAIERVAASIGKLADGTLASTLASITNRNTELFANWSLHVSFDTPLLDVEELSGHARAAGHALQAPLTAKSSSPLREIVEASATKSYASHATEMEDTVVAYNARVKAITEAIEAFRVSFSTEDREVVRRQRDRGVALLKKNDPLAAGFVAAYSEAKRLKSIAVGKKDEAKAAFDSAMQSSMTLYLTEINLVLSKFTTTLAVRDLGHNYVGSGRPKAEFAIQVLGHPIAMSDADQPNMRNALSDGDKRSLALAFFIARTHVRPDLASYTLVFDDPMSSFDENRRSATLSQISKFVGVAQQVIVASHDPYFLRDLERKFRRRPIQIVCAKIVRQGPTYSNFEQLDLADACKSQYARDFETIRSYVGGWQPGDEDGLRAVARSLRPVAEGYLHMRFPGSLPEGTMLGKALEKIQRSVAGDDLERGRPLLSGLNDLLDYTNPFHHNTETSTPATAQVRDAELMTFARQVLDLVHNGTI